MAYNPYRDHMAEIVLSAEPLELVALLNVNLRESIREARRALARGDIQGRARAVSRSVEILAELHNALDRERGGALAGRLASLYSFLIGRLQEGNFKQQDSPLAEAEAVVAPLVEAWNELQPASVV